MNTKKMLPLFVLVPVVVVLGVFAEVGWFEFWVIVFGVVD